MIILREVSFRPNDSTYGKMNAHPINNLLELKSNDEALTRALSILDRTPTTVCVKVGIIYVGDHQHNEEQILANTAGSPRYFQVRLKLVKSGQRERVLTRAYMFSC